MTIKLGPMFLYSFEFLLAVWLAISLFLSYSSLPSFISSTIFLSLLLQQLCLQNACTNYSFREITDSLDRKHLLAFSKPIHNSACFFFQILKLPANFTSAMPSLNYTMENTVLSKSRVNAFMLKKSPVKSGSIPFPSDPFRECPQYETL